MGIKERRLKEKAAMRQLILDSALELVVKHGLDSLTIRGLADQIQYSPTIIYEYFKNKELICHDLGVIVSDELIATLKKVPASKDPEDHLVNMLRANVEFLHKRPQTIELFSWFLYRYDPDEVPEEFKGIINLYLEALKKCKCKHLHTEKQLEEALDILTALHVGMFKLSRSRLSAEGTKRIGHSLENGIKSLLKGWS